MFDIGWGEMFLIGIVALIVVGPKELPALFRTVGNFTGKARAMAREFQRSMESAANEAGMSDVTKSLNALDRNLNSATASARRYAEAMTKAPEGDKPAADKPRAVQAGASEADPAKTEPAAAAAPAGEPGADRDSAA